MYNLSNALIQNMFLVAMAMAAIFSQQQQGVDAFGSFIKDLFNKTTIKLQNFQVPMIIYVLNYAHVSCIGVRGMSRFSGLRNDNNKRTFYKERKFNKRRIHFLSKQNIKAPLILDMYGKTRI